MRKWCVEGLWLPTKVFNLWLALQIAESVNVYLPGHLNVTALTLHRICSIFELWQPDALFPHPVARWISIVLIWIFTTLVAIFRGSSRSSDHACAQKRASDSPEEHSLVAALMQGIVPCFKAILGSWSDQCLFITRLEPMRSAGAKGPGTSLEVDNKLPLQVQRARLLELWRYCRCLTVVDGFASLQVWNEGLDVIHASMIAGPSHAMHSTLSLFLLAKTPVCRVPYFYVSAINDHRFATALPHNATHCHTLAHA